MLSSVVPTDVTHLKRLVAQAMRDHGPNCDLNHIDVSGITRFEALFKNTEFNGNVSGWNMRSAIFTSEMFENAPFEGDLSNWQLPRLARAENMFANSPFNSKVSNWNLSTTVAMEGVFRTPTFQQDTDAIVCTHSGQVALMFHPDYNGLLPRTTKNRIAFYHAIFGGDLPLTKYLDRVPFNDVHAHLLIEQLTHKQSRSHWMVEGDASWASMERVAMVKDHLMLGNELGLPRDEIATLLVQQVHHQEPAALPLQHSFLSSNVQ